MSFTISGDEAYEIYRNSKLKKDGVKSASFETIEAILKKKGVKIRTKPTDSVRTLLLSCARSSPIPHQRSALRAQLRHCSLRSTAALIV